MDLTLLRKFQAFILIILNVSLCASAVAYVHVHMTNDLGHDTIIYLHCLRGAKEMGHQQIPYKWTCQWKFKQTLSSTLLCDANLQGAQELRFLAFNESAESCRSSCGWNFTQHGVFQYDKGEWKFRYNWPHWGWYILLMFQGIDDGYLLWRCTCVK